MSDFDDFQLAPVNYQRKLPLPTLIAGGVLLLIAVVSAVFWFVIRVEVNAGEMLVLVNKTGKTVPQELIDDFGDQVILYPELVRAIAQKTGESEEDVLNGYKGIRLEPLTEGRYFPNPYRYKAIKMLTTQIRQNEMGIQIRKFGKPLAFPKTVATTPDERGPVAEILIPARHNVNLLAYEIQKFPAISIPEGNVGVVTLLSGRDPKEKNTYTVAPGEKGVQRETRPPGLEYYNPYLEQIEIVDVRSHKYDMLNDDAIHFPSNDSFTIVIEGTIEWAIRPDHVAEVTVAYGNEEDILSKIILPNARSIARIQGSKLQAREFINGQTRTAFQDKLLSELRQECWKQGIDIKSALVRDIQPPPEIADLISQREQADQEIERFTNEMEEAKSEVQLVEVQELQRRNKAMGNARREVVTTIKQAEQRMTVAVTNASRELEVARIELQAAEKLASAIVAKGRAEANVILFNYEARAEPLQAAVTAFGGGRTYAQQFFLQKIAPSIKSILSNTEGPFADIFKQFQTFSTTTTQEGGAR